MVLGGCSVVVSVFIKSFVVHIKLDNKWTSIKPEASSTTWMLAIAHFIGTDLCTKYVKLGTNRSSAREHSRC